MTINLNIGVGSEKFSSDSFERIAKGENNKVNIPVTPIIKNPRSNGPTRRKNKKVLRGCVTINTGFV